MNLRKGFGRIYTLLSALILLGVCSAFVTGLPDQSKIDFRYSMWISDRIPTEKYTPVDDVDFACANWSSVSQDITNYCRKRQAELQRLPTERADYIAEYMRYLIGAAAVLYAIRRAARWVANGFSGANDA